MLYRTTGRILYEARSRDWGAPIITPLTSLASNRSGRRHLCRAEVDRQVKALFADLDEIDPDYVPKPEPIVETSTPARWVFREPVGWDLRAAIGLWKQLPFWWSFTLQERASIFPATADLALSLIRSMSREVRPQGTSAPSD
jgi:hypothetical protein